MTMNSAVDVAIGLIFMYLTLGLICTTINEYIATAMRLLAQSSPRQVMDVGEFGIAWS